MIDDAITDSKLAPPIAIKVEASTRQLYLFTQDDPMNHIHSFDWHSLFMPKFHTVIVNVTP